MCVGQMGEDLAENVVMQVVGVHHCEEIRSESIEWDKGQVVVAGRGELI